MRGLQDGSDLDLRMVHNEGISLSGLSLLKRNGDLGLIPAHRGRQALERLIRGALAGLCRGAGQGGGNAVCSHAGITCHGIVSLQVAARGQACAGLFPIHVSMISFDDVAIFQRKGLEVVGEVAEDMEFAGGSQGGVPGSHGSGPPGAPPLLGFGHPNPVKADGEWAVGPGLCFSATMCPVVSK